MKRAIVVGALALAGIWTAAVPAQAASNAAYVVSVKEGSDPAAVAAANGVSPTMVFEAVGGFAANLTSRQVNRLLADAAVESVEVDGIAAIIEPGKAPEVPPPPAQFVTSGVRRIGGLESPTANIDGVDERIDIDVAVLDGGVQPDHPDLNVVGGVDCVGNQGDWGDRSGHGTLVAGFIGAIDNGFGAVGVAPGARIWAVRVASKAGVIKDSSALCGFDWLIQNADLIEVANMSFGFQPDANRRQDAKWFQPCGSQPTFAMHESVCEMVERGVTVAAAAGNDTLDATNQFPAAWPEVIAVSAIGDSDGQPGGLGSNPSCLPEQVDDHFAFFSNYGAAVDLSAPGVCISSTHIDSQYAIGTGTSFSTPLVAGAAALYISTHPAATPAQVQAALVAAGDPGPIPGDPDGYPEPVLNVRGL